MTHTNESANRKAEEIVQELLARYATLNAHEAVGGDPGVGWKLELKFQSQQTLVLDLVADGLKAGRVAF